MKKRRLVIVFVIMSLVLLIMSNVIAVDDSMIIGLNGNDEDIEFVFADEDVVFFKNDGELNEFVAQQSGPYNVGSFSNSDLKIIINNSALNFDRNYNSSVLIGYEHNLNDNSAVELFDIVNVDGTDYRIELISANNTGAEIKIDADLVLIDDDQNAGTYDLSKGMGVGDFLILLVNSSDAGSGFFANILVVYEKKFSNILTCESNRMIGDFDDDGLITRRDANLTLMVAIELLSYPKELCCIDLTNNGLIQSSDATKIFRIVSGIDESPGICHFDCAIQNETINSLNVSNFSACCTGFEDVIVLNNISVFDECYWNGSLSSSSSGICSECGNGVCEDIESVCSCPTDCVGKGRSDYSTVEEFCDNGFNQYCVNQTFNLSDRLCGLCNDINVTLCEDNCFNLGDKECLKNVSKFRECGNFDLDSCLEWGVSVDCPLNTFCDNDDVECVVLKDVELARECDPIGKRNDNRYCSLGFSWLDQKDIDESCLKSYECVSNFCSEDKCVESIVSITKDLGWFFWVIVGFIVVMILFVFFLLVKVLVSNLSSKVNDNL
ncbi:hypothetical protein CMI38_02380 [Candidatus Pacearchaeota archaeon]|nr:hypothetical protein [Candidatus Pacearchaeota archaeon]|tara:strand:- start:85 stop:1737 length:1653 start_codon:yes stop_codon:yes gene_type:complete